MIIKKCEMCGIKQKDCECFLEYTNFKDNLMQYKCLCCNKNCHKMFDRNLHRKAQLKSYINMNTDLRKMQKMILKKIFFKLMNNTVFEKAIEM